MNIGIDIDGVITDEVGYLKEKGKSYFDKEVVNPSAHKIRDLYDVSDDDQKNFWHDNFYDYVQNVSLREDARDILKRIHKDGHKIYIITARNIVAKGFSSLDDLYDKTREYLEKNDIYFDELLFRSNPKVDSIDEFNLDFFIEDAPKNITALSEKIKVIIYDTPYNKQIDNKNTYRAKNWEDIYNIISGE